MGDGPRIYVDANLLIYAVEQVADDPKLTARCQRFLDRVRIGRAVGITSELTLAEVLVEPTRRRLFDVKRAYLSLLQARQPLFELYPADREILTKSVSYRAAVYPARLGPTEDRRNFLPDAIHVATAIAAGVSYYAGSDKRIRLPADMKRLDPREPEFDALLESIA